MKIDPERIRRLHYGYIVAPEGSSDAGQPIPVCGYAHDLLTYEPDPADLSHPRAQ